MQELHDGEYALYGAAKSEVPVVVSSTHWKNECQSVLVSVSQRRSLSTGSRLKNLLPVGKRKKVEARRIQWATECGDNKEGKKNTNSIPRRLSLAEKVELYTDRPDLDLAGIMARLEAIKRLESMTMLQLGRPLPATSTTTESSQQDDQGFTMPPRETTSQSNYNDRGAADRKQQRVAGENEHDEERNTDEEKNSPQSGDQHRHAYEHSGAIPMEIDEDGNDDNSIATHDTNVESKDDDLDERCEEMNYKGGSTNMKEVTGDDLTCSKLDRSEGSAHETFGAKSKARISAEYRAYWLKNRAGGFQHVNPK